MKNVFAFICFFIGFISFAQQKKTIPSGYITFNSNASFEFKNMVIEGDTVTYFNDVTKAQMNFKLIAVKKIVDNMGVTVYEAGKANVNRQGVENSGESQPAKPAFVQKPQAEQLVYESSSDVYMNYKRLSGRELESILKVNPVIYDVYKSGKSDASLGTILVAGGTGLFVFGVLNNLSKAQSNSSGGTPVPLIAGLIAAGVGIPVRIGGVKKIKNAIYQYNELPAKQVSFLDRSEFKFTAGAGSLGFQLKF